MKLKSLALAAALAASVVPAFADNQGITLIDVGDNAYGNIYQATFAALSGSPGVVLNGGTDIITFSGALAGVYNVVLNGSAQFVNSLAGTLNLVPVSITPGPNGFTFFSTINTLSPNFALQLNGIAQADAQYSGNISVTAIPEPETYALVLAGLGVMTFVARRRRPQR